MRDARDIPPKVEGKTDSAYRCASNNAGHLRWKEA